MLLMRLLFYLIFSLGCVAGASAQITDSTEMVVPGRLNSPAQEHKPYVIMISSDGFRHDLADKYQATHLQALRAEGVMAQTMTPCYPSVTFPNHYSLATGLYPAHHGLVDNTFVDPKQGRRYRIGDPAVVGDSSFYGGIPLWVLAEQQHMISASYFWVGSEAAVDGVRPTYWYKFNIRISWDTRLQQVKTWLRLPEALRPHLILFYLNEPDHTEHEYGPDSKETEQAVHQVDDFIDKMVRTVDSLHLPVNYIFVSDHGMGQVDTTHPIAIPTIDTTKFTVAIGGTMIHLYAKDPAAIAPTYQSLKQGATDYDVYLAGETPAHWHYATKDDRYHRIGDIVLVAHFPLIFHGRGRMIAGAHGYDNAIPEMGATFFAWGPAFRGEVQIPAFENVNVYPLVARILGLTISQPIDGSVKVLEGVLK
jgi:predicted AlkP superfamily pyrophosphatase or phosphodiesterase